MRNLKGKESMSNLSFALILSLILVFMVLAAQFESVMQPFVIMLTIPLAGVGTVLTFFILGKTLNMMAYIGIIMLGGIAVNNAILLIDRINQLRENGITKKEAIVLAGYAKNQTNTDDQSDNHIGSASSYNRNRRKCITQSSNGACCNWRTCFFHPADAYCDSMCILGL